MLGGGACNLDPAVNSLFVLDGDIRARRVLVLLANVVADLLVLGLLKSRLARGEFMSTGSMA